MTSQISNKNSFSYFEAIKALWNKCGCFNWETTLLSAKSTFEIQTFQLMNSVYWMRVPALKFGVSASREPGLPVKSVYWTRVRESVRALVAKRPKTGRYRAVKIVEIPKTEICWSKSRKKWEQQFENYSRLPDVQSQPRGKPGSRSSALVWNSRMRHQT